MGPFTTAPRKTLGAHANELVGIFFDAINETREIAARARTAADFAAETGAQRVIGFLAARGIELGVGRSMRLDVNVRNQESLPDLAALPAELLERLNPIFDDVLRRQALGTGPRPRMLMGEAKRIG